MPCIKSIQVVGKLKNRRAGRREGTQKNHRDKKKSNRDEIRVKAGDERGRPGRKETDSSAPVNQVPSI